jgi:hypothetical protein
VDLHTSIERSLPNLPKEATPQQIDKNQRALENLVREARATAKPGDVFTPEAREYDRWRHWQPPMPDTGPKAF